MKTITQAMTALITMGVLGIATPAAAAESSPGDLIINEYNAVGPAASLTGSNGDSFFGHVTGNGGDWIELVVTKNNADIRGWTLQWANNDPDSGTVTFTNNAIWTNLKAGTIITLRAGDTNDTSYNPVCGGDWWIRINSNDTTYVTQTGHTFKTDNDGWRARILDDATVPQVVQNWVGEPPNGVIWNGDGLGNDEVGKLEANPTANASNYSDGDCSTFGQENCWDDGNSEQNFNTLRGCP